MASIGRRFGALHWRLTFFYTVTAAVMFALLGWAIDRQLGNFARLELQDQLVARSFQLLNAGHPPPKPPPFAGPAARAGVAAEAPGVGNLHELARQAATVTNGGMTATILADGAAVRPVGAPRGSVAEADLAPELARAAAVSNRPVGPAWVVTSKGSYLVLEQPVAAPGRKAVLQLSAPAAAVDSLVRSFRLMLIAGLMGLLLASLALGRPLAGVALRPLRRLSRDIRQLTPDRLDLPVSVPVADDELRDVALAFNHMLARIDGSVRAERLSQEQLRRFLADASHELLSPLTALFGYDDLLLRDGGAADATYVGRRMRRELERMRSLVRDLLTLTRLDAAGGQAPPEDLIDLVDLADEAVDALTTTAGERRLTVEAPENAELTARGDRLALERVLTNLVSNAIRHTRPDGAVAVRLRRRGNWVDVAVEDDGEGIAPEHLPHIFERFYRVDASRSRDNGNAGLGLAIVQAIVHQHRGHVTASSRPGEGSKFVVTLPLTVS